MAPIALVEPDEGSAGLPVGGVRAVAVAVRWGCTRQFEWDSSCWAMSFLNTIEMATEPGGSHRPTESQVGVRSMHRSLIDGWGRHIGGRVGLWLHRVSVVRPSAVVVGERAMVCVFELPHS